jgi:N-carbamoyl-L-amino-acid hydrolase
VRGALADSCREHGFAFLEMVSRAYHDSLFISRIAPTGMLFIPCRNGYSHRPDEYAAPEDIARGALVLAETLARLSNGLPSHMLLSSQGNGML